MTYTHPAELIRRYTKGVEDSRADYNRRRELERDPAERKREAQRRYYAKNSKEES